MTDPVNFDADDIPGVENEHDIVWQILSDKLRKDCAQAVDDDYGKKYLPFTAGQLVHRVTFALSYYDQKIGNLFRWATKSVEGDNYTYQLTERNRRHLAHFVSVVTGHPESEISAYIEEINDDGALRAHFATVMQGRQGPMDIGFHPGRRMGWYAIVRALKPKIVVETGVARGHGSLTLAAAILRNRAEGHAGRYVGTDINPEAGMLFCGDYAQAGTILYGDSLESLWAFNEKIDLFINDSDHSASYESEEYDLIESKLAENALILGDNAHATDALLEFSRRTGRNFLFFREDPQGHWYPGAGIGVAFPAFPKTSSGRS
ncbi:hypothetical protein F11_07450 [Rhodospirillum rubrum F11]|uniref:Class I SAM-dependent methyltransferase n=1 Tax=Rhodospirillum rubrum (strain ATCC 11170 / ATH 1.1.1 / DSM 467 / LMG 4362 / NCIMB 8255 / S1) TaxID=269796 RepID=Q2RUF1_RHORT|nr:class I SAM-dependent methyltransferase [Rhodospirillum rubrum]ABC22244.1 hypothetical protein Rru_A1443 [Rhodospirillum rubrum ATCC 11170]AEO47960.1 hypothetical protein F11_07450 [Rhodospirillum rubrum F11]MBK5953810.1 hypothetical protein [Rhodospirillum rubrum]QXG81888.1 class I SAM-dependent methyltransferase [Rhodospirillum rubrum]HAP99372.1 class I SAM-dependent methyltransferase [Rhodospirillum rubrum]